MLEKAINTDDAVESLARMDNKQREQFYIDLVTKFPNLASDMVMGIQITMQEKNLEENKGG
jgi:hypothetical protein|tara:strand:- start:954 stop:1136 length:183 start_codon:yes stop_codon:yes gene_type:complete